MKFTTVSGEVKKLPLATSSCREVADLVVRSLSVVSAKRGADDGIRTRDYGLRISALVTSVKNAGLFSEDEGAKHVR